MKIEIIKDGLQLRETKEPLKKGQQIELEDKRAKRAIKDKKAKEVKTKKSYQKKTEDKLEKK